MYLYQLASPNKLKLKVGEYIYEMSLPLAIIAAANPELKLYSILIEDLKDTEQLESLVELQVGDTKYYKLTQEVHLWFHDGRDRQEILAQELAKHSG